MRDTKVRSAAQRQGAHELHRAGSGPGGTPEQFAKLMREDYGKYERLVRELDVKAN
jgi:hypothetical protein